ncbi:MAG TPA: hypothetical protein VNX88_21680 [Terriglobales bacterium]|jgi:hypothetical protein|nr:hypothetical protein [Terriglobales bacterium]
MYMVGPDIDRERVPLAYHAGVPDGSLDEVPLLDAKCDRRLLHETLILPPPILVLRQKR